MITFNQVKMKNFLSVGEEPLIFHLDKSPTTIISGSNGVGKCIRKSTIIDINIPDKECSEVFNEFIRTKSKTRK